MSIWEDKKKREAAEKILGMFPAEWKDKSPEEVGQLLKAATDAQGKVTQLETDNQRLNTELTTTKSQVGEIRTKLQQMENAAKGGNRQPDPNGSEPPVDFIDDPDKAFNQRAAPLARLAVINAAQTARILAQQTLDNEDMASEGKRMDGRLFRAWANDITKESEKYQTTALGTPDAWIGIFYHLKGTRADELANPEIRKKNYPFLEPASSQVVTQKNEGNKDPVSQLTEEEKKVADKMHVSYENYAKRKSAMKFVNA